MFVQPGQRMGHDFISAAQYGLVAILARAFVVETGIVLVKPAVKAGSVGWFRLQDNRADKCRRVIPASMQDGRTVREIRRQRCFHVIYLMELWIRARENGSVRWRRQRSLRVGASEDGGVARHRIKVWRQAELRAEEPHAIGTSGVEGNENNIRMRRRTLRGVGTGSRRSRLGTIGR